MGRNRKDGRKRKNPEITGKGLHWHLGAESLAPRPQRDAVAVSSARSVASDEKLPLPLQFFMSFRPSCSFQVGRWESQPTLGVQPKRTDRTALSCPSTATAEHGSHGSHGWNSDRRARTV